MHMQDEGLWDDGSVTLAQLNSAEMQDILNKAQSMSTSQLREEINKLDKALPSGCASYTWRWQNDRDDAMRKAGWRLRAASLGAATYEKANGMAFIYADDCEIKIT